jgi:hypothetical protein
MWWQGAGWDLPQGHFELAYSARSSNYLGQPGVQVTWVDARQVETSTLTEVAPDMKKRLQRRLHDYRAAPDPWQALAEGRLAKVNQLAGAQVWAEGLDVEPEGALTRLQLELGEALVVFSIPPGPAELRSALERTEAREIYLFAAGEASDTPEKFLERLAGLVKYTLRTRAGQATLAELAGALGQREASVQAGLDWLQARGQISLQTAAGGSLVLEAIGAKSEQIEQHQASDSRAAFSRLKRLLEETRAYRSHYRQAAVETLTDL